MISVKYSIWKQHTIPVTFLYINGEMSVKGKNYPIHNNIKNSKILRSKFNQGSEKNLYNENYKTFLK